MAEMPDGLARFRNEIPPTHDERVSRTEGVDPAPGQPLQTTTDLTVDTPAIQAVPVLPTMPTDVTAMDPAALAQALVPDQMPEAEGDAPELPESPAETRKHDTQAEEPDSLAVDPTDPQAMAAICAAYGDDCPLMDPTATDSDWVDWAKGLWARHKAGVQDRLHLVERNRYFRKGQQWISSNGSGPWREPPKPRDAARIVDNMIAPALDQRVNLVIEQRPGFKARPATQDPDDTKKAEAAQNALEYQWDQQGMGGANGLSAEAAYWPQTDGVAFLELSWDPDRGPWHESEEMQDGQGNVLAPAMHGPLGDIKTRVLRIEQVRVSADATATQKPWYWVIRETIPTAQAVKEYGPSVVQGPTSTGLQPHDDATIATAPLQKGGYVLPDLDALVKDQPTVDRVTVYCERSAYLPHGLQLTAVGNVLAVPPMPLLCGVVPMVRWTDGSTDPSFYPEPIMDGWIDVQMRQNALWSKWIEGIRKMAGVNLLARKGAIATDTLKGGVMNVINVEGSVDLNSVVRELGNYSMAADVKEALAANQKRFEDLSGWSDASRGSFDAGESGRSILAQREVLERIFAPPINAAAKAMTEWAKITLAFMRWGYDVPRTIAVEGKSRMDLGQALQADDLDGVTDVWLDPETLRPMPTALRLFLLDQMLEKQLISPEEYRRRMPFAFVQNLDTPDLDHSARAKRVVAAIKATANPLALPIKWQDAEAIHQDALEREIILTDDQPPEVVAAAEQRWLMLAQQAAQKAQAMAPAMPGMAPGGPPGSGPAQSAPMDPNAQPTLGSSPPIAANAMSRIGGSSDAEAEARGFDQRTAA